jgi:tyrosine-specific transport protein
VTPYIFKIPNHIFFMKKRSSNLFCAIATLTGTIIGAGILGLPYVFSKAGFLIGLVDLIVLGVIALFINLYLGEIILRTKTVHHLPGYAEKYIGKKGKYLMLISSLTFLYGALIAYTIGEGEALSFVIFGNLNFSIMMSLIFFLVMLPLIYYGLKALEKGETIGLIAVTAIILAIFGFFVSKINLSNFMFVSPSPMMWFMPYGAILFAFMALSAMPEVREELKGEEKKLKKAIVIGSLIPIVLYILFVVAVFGFSGQNTPEIATLALGRLPTLLAVFTMFTAFCALGIALKELYIFDFKVKHDDAFAFAFFPAFIIILLILLLNLVDFVKIISLIGGISGGLAGIIILFILRKAKKTGQRKPEYSIPLNWPIIIILSLIFLAGIVYQFVF